MDAAALVDRNLSALRAIVAALLAMAGLSPGQKTLPRHLHRSILRLLRPAEAAARRLVIVLARDVVVPASALRPHGWRPIDRVRAQKNFPLSLPLFDRFKRFARRKPPAVAVPRISMPGLTPPFTVAPRLAPTPDDPIHATRLKARLSALLKALDDPEPLAVRMARWQARRRMLVQAADAKAVPRSPHGRRLSPLRPGRPPGQFCKSRRSGERHRVHDILEHAHELALCALERRDTS